MIGARVPLRIAVIGAECTGKTELATALAGQLSSILLPERLREFCDEHGRTPRADEQAWLMEEQMNREAEALIRASDEGIDWVISDSTPLLTALYSVELFGDPSLLDRAVAHQRAYALTLLPGPELPWVADGIQRDGPKARESFHWRLMRTVLTHSLQFVRVEGSVDQRVSAALEALRRV